MERHPAGDAQGHRRFEVVISARHGGEGNLQLAGARTPSSRAGSWKLILAAKPRKGAPVQLDNLAADPGGTNHLAVLRSKLEAFIRNGRTTPGWPQKNDVEVNRYPAIPTCNRQTETRPTDHDNQP